MVIDRAHPLNLESLHAQNIQSIIVEGGTETLQSFIVQGLWDELRVETNTSLTVSDGTRAPQLPASAQVVSSHIYGKNVIVVYQRKYR
jgi:diaminohydroxyphosphoribosylaminopyrimidine deaminase/5-amino-6-(5-phosphoribosylamino)uracil reductase